MKSTGARTPDQLFKKHLQILKQDLQIPTKRTRLDVEINQLWQPFLEYARLAFPFQEYRLDKNNNKQIAEILKWIVADPSFNGDLNKGICLQGPKGTGKTWSMWAIQQMTQITPKETKYKIIRSQEITAQYEEGGWEAIKHYTNGNWLFDDLGEEKQEAIHYGTRSNVIQEILTARYANRLTTGIMTHATTNYTQDDLARQYGPRIQSRMKELFNFITLPGEDRRR